MSIENFKIRDPFSEAEEDFGPASNNTAKIHIRIQQRNGRKTLTTVTGLTAEPKKREDTEKSIFEAWLSNLKKKFACNGTIIDDPEHGKVIQLQGDQRNPVFKWLTNEAGMKVSKKDIQIHGF